MKIVRACDYCQGNVDPAGDMYYCCNCGKKFNRVEYKKLKKPRHYMKDRPRM